MDRGYKETLNDSFGFIKSGGIRSLILLAENREITHEKAPVYA